MRCARGMTGIPFAVFADVDEVRRRIGGEASAGLLDGELAHARACFVDERQKGRAMIHRGITYRNSATRLPGDACDDATRVTVVCLSSDGPIRPTLYTGVARIQLLCGVLNVA